jgi:hypothetical protein
MARAHVNSVNIFAKGLHGYSYYPTTIGTPHPGLSRDLLGEQIEALHQRGIKAQAYLGVLWDDLAAQLHPEWVAVDKAGQLLARPALSNESVLTGGRGWSVLDLASGYADYVLAQIEEVRTNYNPDGFWLDIVSITPNYSPAGAARLTAAGLDLSDDSAVAEYYLSVRQRFMDQAAQIIWARHPQATIFHNHTADSWLGRTLDSQNQIDIESLPTDGAWGYLHYPVMARYARTFGRPVVGMTGRFHRSWADFGGLKTPAQLVYEAGTIASAGGSVAIGDQLDPSGRLDQAVYDTIGQVLSRFEALEPWLEASQPEAEAAIVAQFEPTVSDPGRFTMTPSQGVLGAAQMLLELGVQFDVVDGERVVAGSYKIILLPDAVQLSPLAKSALERARQSGASLISAGPEVPDLADPPVKVTGPVSTIPCYFRAGRLVTEPVSGPNGASLDADTATEAAGGPVGAWLDTSFRYVSYGGASLLEALPGAQLEGEVIESRFDRTWQHFTSHLDSPAGSDGVGPLVGIVKNWAHIATPVFTEYASQAYWTSKAVVDGLIRRLYPERMVSHGGPAWVEVTLHHLAPLASGRPAGAAIHLTAYQPRRSSAATPRLDTSHALAGFPIWLRLPARPVRVFTAPDRLPVPFTVTNDQVTELLPAVVEPHMVIVAEY